VIPVGGVLSVLFGIMWKLFDMAIGGIQAFIFALLTVLYFGMAGAHGEEAEHDHDDTAAQADTGAGTEAEPELAA
jgi:F-type H+-transporting ATPase subunit a